MSKLLIVGAGGHGKVVADAALSTGKWNMIAFLDDRFPELLSVRTLAVIGTFQSAQSFINDYQDIVVAVGDNVRRLELTSFYKSLGFHCPPVIHPSATIDSTAQIGNGTVVLPHAVINADAVVGSACIINTASVIEHDCRVGDGVHVSPRAVIGGGSEVGELSWIGIGATVIHKIAIGDRCIIGAGSVVTSHIGHNVTAVGMPARVIKENSTHV